VFSLTDTFSRLRRKENCVCETRHYQTGVPYPFKLQKEKMLSLDRINDTAILEQEEKQARTIKLVNNKN
jgi:hypothetical protein